MPPRHFNLQWHVTEKCNLRCRHCYQHLHAESDQENPTSSLVPLQYIELLRAVARDNNVRGHLTLTGGEPFAWPPFLGLLFKLSRQSGYFSLSILSNGTLIDASVAAFVKKAGVSSVQVSIDGTEQTHDRIRGPGTFKAAVSGLEALIKQGVHTLVSFTAQAANYREFPEVAALSRALGVRRVWADRLIPEGQASANGESSLTPEQTKELFLLMRGARRRRSRTEIAMHRALQFIVSGGKPYRCPAGRSLLTVMPDGAVYPCRRMPIPVGNIICGSLKEIYRENSLLAALRNDQHVAGGCRGCFYAKLCGGGLRCLAYAESGSPFEADPGCWLTSPRHNETYEGGNYAEH